VNALVLVSTLPAYNRPYPVSLQVDEQLYTEKFITPETLTAVYNLNFGPEFKKRVRVDEFIACELANPNPQSPEAYLSQLRALENFDLLDRVSSINNYTLIVTGDGDNVVSHENSRWMSEKILNSEFKLFEGVGHMVPVEAPQELAEYIESELLKRD